jgi:hypothetical protein
MGATTEERQPGVHDYVSRIPLVKSKWTGAITRVVALESTFWSPTLRYSKGVFLSLRPKSFVEGQVAGGGRASASDAPLGGVDGGQRVQ